MKYERGSFITVGSRDTLRGLHPTAQALYMWLSSYANETGNCFPSRKTLAKDVGCSETMIDNMVQLLCENGLVKVKGRKEGDKQLSNLYTVLIVPPIPQSGTPPTTESPTPYHDVGTNSNQLTQPIERGDLYEVRMNSDIERQKELPARVLPRPYSIEACRRLWQDGEMWMVILEWYMTEKGLWGKATTPQKLRAIMYRHKKAAERLARAGWERGEVMDARKKIAMNDSLTDEWTLETVDKYLTK